MRPFLVLQARPEDEAADNELEAILDKGGLSRDEVHRVRLEQDELSTLAPLDNYAAIILGGGPPCFSDPPETQSPIERTIESRALELMPAILATDKPFLGCCYGIGLLGVTLDADVSKHRYSEPVGTSACQLTEAGQQDPVLAGVAAQFDAFVGHKEALQELPPGCVHLVSSETCPMQMIRHGEHVYATQFHPEADAEGFKVRIRLYRDKGYFPPETADDLIAMCEAADVHEPARVLANFVSRYRDA